MSYKKDNSERNAEGFQPISASFAPLAKKLLGKKGFVELEIITDWEDIAGKEISEFIHPQSIEFKKGEKSGGTLYVLADSGAFATELNHKQAYIIEKINTYFGYAAVSKLQIIQAQQNSFSLKNTEPSTKQKKTLVTFEEQNYIDEQTADIKDKNLQQAIKKLGINIMQKEEEN